MTVKELIEILKNMPENADVLRLNTEEDRWYSEHYDYISKVKYNYNDNEVIIE